jgi:exonuclease III
VNIYGPNNYDPIFFENIIQKISHFQNSSIIWGGDFNVVQDYILDTSNMNSKNNPKTQEKISKIKEDLDLTNPWSLLNPKARTYTWHCNRKQSRLDYFLISGDLFDNINTVSIKPGYRSDHSMVEMCIDFDNNKKRTRDLEI